MSEAFEFLIARAHNGSGRITIALLAVFFAAAALTTTSCGSGSNAEAQPPPAAGATAPAITVDNTRVSDQITGFALNNDFTRLFFTNKPAPIINLGRTDKVYQGKLVQARAFMSATILYQPPLSVIDDAHFVGSDDPDAATNDLVAMRCKPSDAALVQPLMASWPNIFKAATSDLANLMGYTPADCPAPDASYPVDQRVYCAALGFSDSPNTMVPLVLQNAIDTGATVFQLTGTAFIPTGSTTGANVLYDLYGIGAGFSGLGYSVENSYLVSEGGNVPLTAAQALEQSVVTEYVLMNVPLTDANCRCVRVSPYDSRDMSPLNWNRVWSAGRLDPSDGHCVVRSRLP
ncbi:MAG TPA: hypothetical protein VMV15_07465 [Candidatus Binataceae bacterium]|nr:hypothetical protein [Candidatus Binataceae bacterium]